MSRPPKFGPGETCELCVFFFSGKFCKKYRKPNGTYWEVDHADWCDSYKAKPSHLHAFEIKEAEERKKKLL